VLTLRANALNPDCRHVVTSSFDLQRIFDRGCYTRPMRETRGIRLRRLAATERASAEAHTDDVIALHKECRQAESENWTVREIARVIGRSPAHTHRIMAGLTGPVAA
jgi:hypothetical protein